MELFLRLLWPLALGSLVGGALITGFLYLLYRHRP
jgi:formate/nitrite transporter FocA (FNT family)